MITHLSLVQSEEEVGMVSDGVDQNAILDRPEVQLDVQSAGGGDSIESLASILASQ